MIDALSPKDLQDMHTCSCYIYMKEYIEKAELSELFVGDNVKIGYSSGYNYLQEKGDTYYVSNHPYIGKS